MNESEFVSARNYDELSEKACNFLIEAVKKNSNCVICLATGASPTKSYRLFVEKVKSDNIDISGITFVKLDEWLGVQMDDECTCESYLMKNIITPLGIKEDKYISFNTQNEESKECSRIKKLIEECGGIDICVLGLGKNGHLGLNEPENYIVPDSHVVELDSKTKTHEMLKNTKTRVKLGITLGLSQILNSKEILFLISGEDKKDAFANFTKGIVSTQLPCSFLWLHENVKCIYDSSEFSI